MTGAWSIAFSFSISVVFWQETDGDRVRGADRGRRWIVWFHHLKEGGGGG